MAGTNPLDGLPLLAIFVLAVAAMLVAAEAGYRAGVYRRARSDEEKEGPVGAMVAATLGLLAFILAFTFNLAAGRLETRRELVVREANALGTTYLRSAMLPERGPEIRALLRRYAELRIEAAQVRDITDIRRQSEELQTKIWDEATALARGHNGSIIVALFIQSLNEVIDVHTMRLAALRNRVPSVIWIAVFVLSSLSFAAMGYHGGLTRTQRSPAALVITICFAVVINLIVDLDRPFEGFLRANQQPMVDARQGMTEP
jgi:hypothetical protein